MARTPLLVLATALSLATAPSGAVAEEPVTLTLFGILISTTVADGAAAATAMPGDGQQVIGGIHGDAAVVGTAIDLTHAPGARSFGYGGRSCQIIGGISGSGCGGQVPKPRD